jgi:hypothetical protein
VVAAFSLSSPGLLALAALMHEAAGEGWRM